MRVVLWDTRKLDASKDYAGGFGIGMYPGGGGLRGRIIRRFFTRDRRPVALLFAHLAAIFHRLGHQVEYSEDCVPGGADLYVFYPSLVTLNLEREAITRVKQQAPEARVLVVGPVASVMPEAFADLGATVVKGEAEQLYWKLDEVLAHPGATVQLGTLEDLDSLPPPDWTPFHPERFRIGYDFWRFPTALIQQSRGCTMKCNYCPYIILENQTRLRDPEAVVDEIRHDITNWNFRSFKFRDPLFGVDRDRVYRLVELIGRLPRKIQFSIETRIDLMPPEVLRALRRVGLTSITVGIESPNDTQLRQYHRAPVKDDRQREFVRRCRALGIRTVAGFMIGFPEDTEESIHGVLRYAMAVGPTFANFNVVTPYPGTEFYEKIKDRIADFDYRHYTVYHPVLKYDHLSAGRVSELLGKCFRRYYFRWQYLRENASLLWPFLGRFGGDQPETAPAVSEAAHPGPPRPKSALAHLDECKNLRKDGPHHRPGLSPDVADRH